MLIKKFHIPAICMTVIASTFSIPAFGKRYPVDNHDASGSEQTFYGVAKLKNQQYATLNCFGPTVLEQSQVSDQANIYGPLTTNKTTFNKLQAFGPVKGDTISFQHANIQGPITLKQAKASGTLTVLGPLHAQDSRFMDVFIACNELTFDNCFVNNLSIKQTSSDDNVQQILRLKGNTTIHGKISFESGNGIIELHDPEVKIHTIEGATLKRAY